MSTETIFWLAYAVIGIVAGYFAARDCYRGGMTDVEKGSAGWAFVVWFVFGATWPLWFAFIAMFFLIEWTGPAFRWVAKRIF